MQTIFRTYKFSNIILNVELKYFSFTIIFFSSKYTFQVFFCFKIIYIFTFKNTKCPLTAKWRGGAGRGRGGGEALANASVNNAIFFVLHYPKRPMCLYMRQMIRRRLCLMERRVDNGGPPECILSILFALPYYNQGATLHTTINSRLIGFLYCALCSCQGWKLINKTMQKKKILCMMGK